MLPDYIIRECLTQCPFMTVQLAFAGAGREFLFVLCGLIHFEGAGLALRGHREVPFCFLDLEKISSCASFKKKTR